MRSQDHTLYELALVPKKLLTDDDVEIDFTMFQITKKLLCGEATELPLLGQVPIQLKKLTRFGFGRHSMMEKRSRAFPSGSSGRQTPRASTNIWYRHLVNKGSGSSRR